MFSIGSCILLNQEAIANYRMYVKPFFSIVLQFFQMRHKYSYAAFSDRPIPINTDVPNLCVLL
jgi:hypothetical protein